jgi:hypothetical protein
LTGEIEELTPKHQPVQPTRSPFLLLPLLHYPYDEPKVPLERLELGPNPDNRDIAKWARTSPSMIAAFYDQNHLRRAASRA